MITIRSAQTSDYDRIITLLQYFKLLTDAILAEGTRYWVAQTEAGELAACAGVEFGEDAVLLRSLAVYEAFQGERLALRLIENALDEAAAAGYQHVYCFSTRAADYFQRVGFRQVPVEQLVQALPNAPQVVNFRAIGKLAGERAWYKALR